MSAPQNLPDVPSGAFSADGCIVSQPSFAAVPYGVKRSDYNGCGWMAAYNLLHLLGRCADWREVVRGMRFCTLLLGLLGTDPFALRRYLRRRGVRTKVFFRPSRAAAAADGHSGILMYWHGRGAHFTAFQPADGKHRFLNVRRGDGRHIEAMADFLAARSRAALVVCLIVRDETRGGRNQTDERP